LLYAATSLTDLTCGHARNAAGAASSIAAKANGQINVPLGATPEPASPVHAAKSRKADHSVSLGNELSNLPQPAKEEPGAAKKIYSRSTIGPSAN
jgi:hypothetical protein